MDVVAVETLVPDLHIGAERVDGGKILDREASRSDDSRAAADLYLPQTQQLAQHGRIG
jgi:hypothetical protein